MKYYYEYLSRTSGHFFEIKEVLRKRTKWQEIVIGDSSDFGRCLILDGIIQLAEKDEAIYHENLIHPALLIHPNPKKVLILGGGDGCALREVLKHKRVKKVSMVELDEEMIKTAKKELARINKNSFNDKRVELVIGDAVEYVKKTKQRFDVVVMDLVDPSENWKNDYLYSLKRFEEYKNLLNENGILVTHAEDATKVGAMVGVKFYEVLRRMFKHAAFYTEFVPSFESVWAFVMGSDGINLKKVSQKQINNRAMGIEFRHFNPENFRRLFVYPRYIEEEMERLKKIRLEKLNIKPSVVFGGFTNKRPFPLPKK